MLRSTAGAAGTAGGQGGDRAESTARGTIVQCSHSALLQLLGFLPPLPCSGGRGAGGAGRRFRGASCRQWWLGLREGQSRVRANAYTGLMAL